MASILLSSVGASVGNALLPGLGGRILGSIGRKFGRSIDQEIGWSSSTDVKDGARLENFKIQDSRYGLAIPLTFGQARVAGNVIWASDLIETAHKTEVGGGKGGVIGGGQTRTTYSYSINCAIALGEGEIGGIQTIWADSKVIYQDGVWLSGVVGSVNIHMGMDDQSADPLLESWLGAGLTPAYRGIAYIVLQGLQLGKFGNRLPNMTFELLPKTISADPVWQGQVDPDITHAITTNKQGGMPPLVIEGGALSARQMLVGGYNSDGSTGQFVIVTYDVTGEEPIELRRDVSPSFVCQSVGDHSWAIAPDGRFIALGLQDGSSGNPYHTVIYDTMTNSFGAIQSTNMLGLELRQIAWIDAQYFVVSDLRNTARGVRVYMRSGTSVLDRGFYDVWGAGSSGNRVPVAYTQFRALGDGLLTFMGDRALNLTALYARYLCWTDNKLTVGEPFTVFSGYNVGSGSGAQVTLHKTGEQEWTLFYLTLIDMQMMSFVATQTGVTITRPWQKFTSGIFTSSACNVPVVMGSRVVLLHRPSTETLYRISEIRLDEGTFARVSDALDVPDYVSPAVNFNAVRISGTRLLVSGNVGFAGRLGQLGIIRRYEAGDSLAHVVGTLLERAGYAPTDYELSALAGIVVEGYTISEQASAASALQQLMLLAPFDLVETDGMLRAVLHGQGAEIAIPADEAISTITQTRAKELDLPVELGIDYLDASRDYEVGSQRARRMAARGAVAKLTLDMPIVCNASRTKKLAQRHLFAVWIERDHYRLDLSRTWAMLEPSDVLVFDGHRIRVTSVVQKDGLVQVDGVACVPATFEGTAQAESGSAENGRLAAQVTSSLYLMDLPLLRKEDDQAGIYVAVSGIDGWKGATLWRAADGINFTSQTSFELAATAGAAASVLQPQTTLYMDRVSSVRVQLLRGSLSSCTASELLNGANVALCGAEIIQFQTATLVGPDLYELSGLLRGRRGTESEIGHHQIGESFVLLNEATVQFLPVPLTDRNVAYHFRAVSSGGSLDLARDWTLAYAFRTLKPLAPVHLHGMRSAEAGSDLTLTWKRRARKNGAWVDYIDVPLDETQELYEVEIMSGANVVRTFAGLSAPTVTYTAAQQAADWGASVPASFEVRVYQMSERYGRGAVCEVAV